MKNTIQIVEKSQCECDGWEESSFAKKKWYSESEIKKAISKCYSYGHAKPLTEYDNNKDDNLICIAELKENIFNTLDSTQEVKR